MLASPYYFPLFQKALDSSCELQDSKMSSRTQVVFHSFVFSHPFLMKFRRHLVKTLKWKWNLESKTEWLINKIKFSLFSMTQIIVAGQIYWKFINTNRSLWPISIIYSIFCSFSHVTVRTDYHSTLVSARVWFHLFTV